jgi:hypothetical protein
LPPIFYLHIGHGKVASSTLQRALQINADTIRSHGILISDEHLEFPSKGPVKGYPIVILDEMMLRLPPEESDRRTKKFLERLSDAISKGGFRGAVISSENLVSERAPRLFRNVSQQFDFRVLYLIRRQDELLQSAWKQWGMKSGDTLLKYVEGQLAAGKPSYLATVRRWQAVGAEVRVVPIHVISDIPAFLDDWVGITDSSPQAVPRINETFDYSVLEILSRNPFLFSGLHDNTIFNTLNELLPKDAPRVGYGLLNDEMREKIMTQFSEENAILHREFYPDLEPLDHYSVRAEGESPDSNSIELIHRYLGINLLLINTLKDRLDAVSENIEAHSRNYEAILKELNQHRQNDRALLNEMASTFPMSLFLFIRRVLRKIRLGTRQPR